MEIALSDLKGEMHDLASVVGVDTALLLCELFAGDNLYIPNGGRREGGESEDIAELRTLLGEDAFAKLQMSFGGTTIYFPTKSAVLKEHIAQRVREQYDGTNRRWLMREYHLTKNSFYRIIEGRETIDAPEDENQMTIFDLL